VFHNLSDSYSPDASASFNASMVVSLGVCL
jgi:hypothetical protein